jgi:hypothetical protein
MPRAVLLLLLLLLLRPAPPRTLPPTLLPVMPIWPLTAPLAPPPFCRRSNARCATRTTSEHADRALVGGGPAKPTAS